MQAQREQFPDVLDLRTMVQQPRAIESTVFSDLGAWHAYALPERREDYGGFIGPLLMDMDGKWMSNSFAQLIFSSDGIETDLQTAVPDIHYFPGMLKQEFETKDFKISLLLIFVSNREAMVRTTVKNITDQDKSIIPVYKGTVFDRGASLQQSGSTIHVRFNKSGHLFTLQLPAQFNFKINLTDTGYTATGDKISIAKGDSISWNRVEAFYPDGKKAVKQSIPDFEPAFHKNTLRWNGYLKRYFSNTGVLAQSEKRLAVKSMVTLITNWRSKSRDLLHDGVFPSVNYQGFYGVWSWDSWKQAVGLGLFEPGIAMDNIRCMFDYQDSAGMVPDCIYSDKRENNWRDTKPPLAAWAVALTYKQSKSKPFLQEMYDKLVRYHRWWFTNRDHNNNGLCEYGSTDGTRIAAAWESGMDNAVRFDSAIMLKNNEQAWSLNQESVDLNAYLYREKLYLAEIATILDYKKAARKWKQEAAILKPLINQAFYDAVDGYYYDRRMDQPGFIRRHGPEGWIPLWAGICSKEQAKAIQKKISNEEIFNTKIPLPTLSASDPAFDPMKGYWRGPVWLDQFQYGIDGLKQYGYHQLAASLLEKLLQHGEGLLGNEPICENYHPLSGRGLNARNFSWSAAHLLLLLKNK
ncbi:MAG: MGH1-like glycoside hydrolase domain-containing protein [Pseudobacter sp.]|uniref:MGH1-like glycoside hydrolase domain-containing protein n=1 Tax=Pseudobacter sp. TaxID=2045420 RepID=UPI003F7EAA9A